MAVAEWKTEAGDAARQASYVQLPAEPTAWMLATQTPKNSPVVVGEVILTADRTRAPLAPPPAETQEPGYRLVP